MFRLSRGVKSWLLGVSVFAAGPLCGENGCVPQEICDQVQAWVDGLGDLGSLIPISLF